MMTEGSKHSCEGRGGGGGQLQGWAGGSASGQGISRGGGSAMALPLGRLRAGRRQQERGRVKGMEQGMQMLGSQEYPPGPGWPGCPVGALG